MPRNDQTTGRLNIRPMSAAELLDAGIAQQQDLIARPRNTPRQVFATWLENLGAGIGIGGGAAVLLYALQAPADLLATASLSAGGLTFAGLMAWRATQDEFAMRGAIGQIKRAFKQTQRELSDERADWGRRETVYLDALDEADASIRQLERSLDQMTRERDNAIYDLSRERKQAQGGRNSYVPPVEITPQELGDATEMIRHRYQYGVHLSRRKAAETKRWTQPRWEAAAAALVDAHVTRVGNGVTEYPDSLEAALQQLGEYMIRAHQLSAPAVNKTLGMQLYVESDEG